MCVRERVRLYMTVHAHISVCVLFIITVYTQMIAKANICTTYFILISSVSFSSQTLSLLNLYVYASLSLSLFLSFPLLPLSLSPPRYFSLSLSPSLLCASFFHTAIYFRPIHCLITLTHTTHTLTHKHTDHKHMHTHENTNKQS